MPEWYQLVRMSGHVEQSETAKKLQLYATSMSIRVNSTIRCWCFYETGMALTERLDSHLAIMPITFDQNAVFHPMTPKFFYFSLTRCPWVQKPVLYTYIDLIYECPLVKKQRPIRAAHPCMSLYGEYPYPKPGWGVTHIFGRTGMCRSNGSPFYKKSLNMGPSLFLPKKKILRVVEWVALIRFLFGMWHY